MTTTSSVHCPCGCGEAVSLTTGGFATTTAEVGACSARRAEGVVSYTIRKSEGLALRPARGEGLSHRDGLVVLG